MSANMETEHLALWMLPSHVCEGQNPVLSHSISPSLKNNAVVRGKEGYQVPLSSCYQWGRGVSCPFNYCVPVGCLISKKV